MMRHDYELPFQWPSMTAEEKCEWYVQERVRRQALKQDTAAAVYLRKEWERQERKRDARAGTVSLQNHR